MADRNLWDRLKTRVHKTETCWIWKGGADRYGHTYVRTINGREYSTTAHRAVYESLVGKIPKGKVLDHLCKNTLCVNPQHLEPVTQQENLMRSERNIARLNSLKTHCKNGHEFSVENTYIRKDRPRKTRECKKCRNLASSKFHRRAPSLM